MVVINIRKKLRHCKESNIQGTASSNLFLVGGINRPMTVSVEYSSQANTNYKQEELHPVPMVSGSGITK